MNTFERERLRQLLTQEELAKKAKVSRNVIITAEAGGKISKLKFSAVCAALGISMESAADINLYDANEDRRKGTRRVS